MFDLHKSLIYRHIKFNNIESIYVFKINVEYLYFKNKFLSKILTFVCIFKKINF